MQLEPENTEEYIDYLQSIGWLDEAATRLAFIVNKVCKSLLWKTSFNEFRIELYMYQHGSEKEVCI